MNWLIIFIILLIICPALTALGITFIKGKKVSRLPQNVDREREESYARKLAEMIRCDTVSSVKHDEDERQKFVRFHEVLRELFPHVFARLEVNDLEGSLLIFWKGRSDERPILLMSHQDVVPVSGDWRFDPFSGEIAEGKVWGRGACDTKCSLMGFLEAAEELLEEGYVPDQDVYLGGSCTEEVGGGGAPRIVAELKKRGVKLFMVCDEGGGIQDEPVPGIHSPIAMIGIQEKGTADVTLTLSGPGGHAHTPPKHDPVSEMSAFIVDMKKRPPFRSRLTPSVRQMLEKLAPYADYPVRAVLSNLWLFGPVISHFTPKISPDAASMLQTTCAFTKLEGSEAYNVIPTRVTVGANMRFIAHQPMEESLKVLEKRAAKHGLVIENVHGNDCTKAADLTGEAFGVFEGALHETFPELGWAPYLLTGATDARFFDEICGEVFRFAPVEYGPEQKKGIHGVDENLPTRCLPGCVDFYKNLIRMNS